MSKLLTLNKIEKAINHKYYLEVGAIVEVIRNMGNNITSLVGKVIEINYTYHAAGIQRLVCVDFGTKQLWYAHSELRKISNE